MKKYSKKKMIFKRSLIVIGVLLVITLITGILLLSLFCFKSNINIVKEDASATSVTDDVALNSKPVIIDNLVIGALYENRWVSTSKYYMKSNNKSDVEIAVYTKDKSAGIYKVEDVYSVENSIYANTSYVNYIDEYFATPNKEAVPFISNFSKVEISDIDYNYVKKALGYLRLYNNSVVIKEAYVGNIDENTPIKLLNVTSENKGNFGGIYNAIIVAYPDKNSADIVAYSYTKDLENTDEYPLYSVEFLADLNGDNKSDLVVREVTEFSASYSIYDYKDGKYTRVLNEVMNVK